MQAASTRDITGLLADWRAGSQTAGEQLGSLVHDELRKIAQAFWLREARRPTLDPTEIVHEAWLSLLGGTQPDWQDRRHFYGIAARLMRQTLAREANRRNRLKRGSGARPVALSEVVLATPETDIDLLALEHALRQLEAIDPGAARLVELRFFTGMSIEDAGDLLGLSRATVVRKWRAARAWLREQLEA